MTKQETMTKQEKIQKLENAQELLRQSIALTEEVFKDEPWFQTYFITPLKIRLKKGHGYLTNDPNFDTAIDYIINS